MPLALIGACALGAAEGAAKLAMWSYAIHMLSLASCHGVRAAFAVQTSYRRVRGSVLCALGLQVFGFCACATAASTLFHMAWAAALALAFPGLCLNVEHTVYEYLYAIGDPWSAALCHMIASLLTLTGLALSGGDGASPWLTILAGMAAAVALTVGAALGDGISIHPNPEPIRRAPRAMLQSAAWPVTFAIFVKLEKTLSVRLLSGIAPDTSPPVSALAPAFLIGLLIFELCRTPFRRTKSESRAMNAALLGLILTAATALLLSLRLDGIDPAFLARLRPVCAAAIPAALCAFGIFGRL